MPVVFTNPQFPYQVGSNPANQVYSVQLNYGQMLREVTRWNPNYDPMDAGRSINNAYRTIIDRRRWYGLRVMGQAQVPDITNGGTANAINGNPIVTGIGTNWTPALVGLQFRAAFTFPYQTIQSVQSPTQLTLQTPYIGNNAVSGYQIVEAYLSFGANVKSLLWATNALQGWPMDVKSKVESINAWDTWRTSLGWATVMATRPPTPDGQYQVEVWPTPYAQQAFPFEAFTQPADMQLDTDSPVAWIRSDILVQRGIADALIFGGKKSDYYDPVLSMAKIKEFDKAVEEAEWADEGLDQQSVMWDYGFESGDVPAGDGSAFAQSHDM